MLVAYAVDIGSTKQNAFAWARATPKGVERKSESVDELVTALDDSLASELPVALGIEAPLYVPAPLTVAGLSSGRRGEGSRSCFAPVGLAVTALGLHQLTYLLMHIRKRRSVTFSPRIWHDSPRTTLFIWEAFVSQEAHSADHASDAVTAVCRFIMTAAADMKSDLPDDPTPVFNLAAASALRAGWKVDTSTLSERCIVVRPPAVISAL